MSEIFPNIHRIEAPLGRRVIAQHFLVGERLHLVDSGVASTPADAIFPYLETIGRRKNDISMLIVTHPDSDHCGGNVAVRKASPRALFVAHELDAPLIEDPEQCLRDRYDFGEHYGCPLDIQRREALRRNFGEGVQLDIALKGGEMIFVSDHCQLEVIHAPGHSDGHIILWEARHRVAIITDAVLGSFIPDSDARPLFAPTYRRTREYLQTIERIRGLKPNCLLASHFPVIEGVTDVTEFLDRSGQFVALLDDAIFEFLRAEQRGCPMCEIIASVMPVLAEWDNPEPAQVIYTLCYPVAGALDLAVKEGRLTVSTDDKVNYYAV